MTQAVNLPPARRTPLAPDEAFDRARLGRRARAFAAETLEGDDVFEALPTGTPVDVGSWLGRRRLRCFATAEALVLVAHGPRPWAERVPYRLLRESLYNHVTGELVLAPADGATLTQLRMMPLDACQVLAQIHCEDSDHA